ncbi:Acyl-CoA synthetase family member 2, mitochondrial [Cytospora mali]|uniref:Acyl-CoA synthetase family member 2, mitochondrial n=1 Tax=Cytospora mali TaxID=578113 RepID=A0A194UVZ6_CYTMA|nr:Acyl-CoA synthetase family member 2, mitochondrial [Valsa mali var. pyri (nom. inval.)]
MPSALPDPPVDCGRRLLPAVVDQLARDEPDRAWCSLPRDDYDLSQGFEDISYARFANAINKLAWFIEESIGKSTTFETVAYLGISDVRYHMIQLAVCKTGHKVLFSSQINSQAVHLSLLEQTDCNVIFTANGVLVNDILSARPMKHAVIPALDDLLESEEVPHYPYEKTYEEAKNDPYLILHTSGTTGQPKPIVWNHALIATQDRHLLLEDVAGRRHTLMLCHPGEGVRYMMPTSPFHAISCGFSMCMSIFGKTVILPGFRDRGVDASEICLLLASSNATKAFFTPWMMEAIARRKDAKRFIEPLESVVFGGAVLSSFAAQVWANHTKIQNVWGSTESLAPPQLESDNADYEYTHFDVFTEGYEFRQIKDTGYVSETGEAKDLYEFVMKTSEKAAPTASWHAAQGIHPSTTSPPYPEWQTSDLWTPHPDPAKAAYAWKFVCRRDDLISFSTGVSGHPAPIERAIHESDKVHSVILIGSEHRQALALIELAGGYEPSPELASKLWEEVIEPANEKAQAHIRVARTHVLLLPAGSFVRTAKGSVVRTLVEAKFKDRIAEVFEKYGDKWQDAKERYGSISQSTEITVEIVTEGNGRNGNGNGNRNAS